MALELRTPLSDLTLPEQSDSLGEGGRAGAHTSRLRSAHAATAIEAPAIIRPEGVRVSWDEARRIMGTSFIGLDGSLDTFGGHDEHYGLTKDAFRGAFPFTAHELERFGDLGFVIIVRPARIPLSKPKGRVFNTYAYQPHDATISAIQQQLEFHSPYHKNRHRTMYTDLQNEPFYNNDILPADVAAVGTDLIPGSRQRHIFTADASFDRLFNDSGI